MEAVLNFLIPLIPVATSAVAPHITEAVKSMAELGKSKVPATLKIGFNAVAAAVTAGLCAVFVPGVEAAPAAGLGGVVGLLQSAAFAVGKKS